jgi:hypothetical protein
MMRPDLRAVNSSLAAVCPRNEEISIRLLPMGYPRDDRRGEEAMPDRIFLGNLQPALGLEPRTC